MIISAALAIGILSGCIQRAPSARTRREQWNRGGLAGSVLLRETPSFLKRIGAVYGDSVELTGLDLSPQRPKPGDTVRVTYYFRVLEELDEDYKIFAHIDNRGGGRGERINGDHWPADGKYPTGVWRRGEVVRDEWTFKVPSYYSGMAIEIWTGFYQPGKDDRLPLARRNDVQQDGQNRALAVTIPMR
jgi:hypothetical protein